MKDKDYNYYGVFLLNSEKKRLKEMFWDILSSRYLEGWKLYCDHCTMLHKTHSNQEPRKYLDLICGHPIKFCVIGVGVSDNAIAVLVDLPSENKISHITLAVAPGHKPVESNDIDDWITFDTMIKHFPFKDFKQSEIVFNTEKKQDAELYAQIMNDNRDEDGEICVYYPCTIEL